MIGHPCFCVQNDVFPVCASVYDSMCIHSDIARVQCVSFVSVLLQVAQAMWWIRIIYVCMCVLSFSRVLFQLSPSF